MLGAAIAATLAGCPLFPAGNAWTQDVSGMPVHPRSSAYVRSISGTLKAGFGADTRYGIPWTTVSPDFKGRRVRFTHWPDHSDKGRYPIPRNAPVEHVPDRHVIVLQKGTCKLFELYLAYRSGNRWSAANGAVWDLRSSRLRPQGWTSADAAGLPILPGLVRRREVRSGEIRHALRFTASRTQRAFVFPARKWASTSRDVDLPPMGMRVRLRADFDLSGYRGGTRVILKALKRYGMILADNGPNWHISGERNRRWRDRDLKQLQRVPGSAFEVVDTGRLVR